MTSIDHGIEGGATALAGAPRLLWPDIAKGIAIIAVVYGHCVRGLTAAGLLEPDALTSIVDYVFYTFHIPAFFAISGYFFRTILHRGSRSFWGSKAQAIAYPYVLWSLIHGCIQMALSQSGAVNEPMMLDRMLMILWLPIAPFWFLYALFFANVAGAVLHRLRPEVGLACFAVANAISIIAPLPSTVADIAYGCTFFFLGQTIAKYRASLFSPRSARVLPGGIALFLAFACTDYYLGIPVRLQFVAPLLGVWCLYSGAMVLQRFGANGAVRLLAYAGRYSMGIFVMHIMVLGFVRLVLQRTDILQPGMLIVVSVGLATLIPALVQICAEKLEMDALLGLSRAPRRRKSTTTTEFGKAVE